jgi:DNA-binding NarL/FixJ family response regulator
VTKLRVVLAEDHRIMREGLRMVLDREPDIEVVGESGDGISAIRVAQTCRPDVVVMDISMPNVNGLQATETMKSVLPDTKVLILTRHTDASYVQRLLRSGASGYVLKRSASEELVRAIRRVVTGQIYLDPAVTEQAIGSVPPGGATGHSPGSGLSKREEDVLRFTALGFLTRETASRLNISIKTVETHKANAMAKIGLASRIDIVRYAMLQGWLDEHGTDD